MTAGHHPARGRVLTVALVLLLAVAGCGGDGSRADGARPRTLTVLAAASLTETFTTLAHTFEKQHPGVDVRLTFDSSATLAQQAAEGAPGDVLATADARTMRMATKAEATSGTPRRFATNTMVLVVPRQNPASVHGFADLRRPGITFVMCDPAAPCGALGRTLLRENHVRTAPKSLEVDVKAVLTKVELDEADAGLVYRTDATAAGDKVRAFPVPHAAQEANVYLMAPLAQASSRGLARQWVRLVLSERGRRVLHAAGFDAP